MPDITDIPTVTVTELPLEVLQPPQNSLDAVIIADSSERSPEERVNRTIEVITDSSKEEIQKGNTKYIRCLYRKYIFILLQMFLCNQGFLCDPCPIRNIYPKTM